MSGVPDSTIQYEGGGPDTSVLAPARLTGSGNAPSGNAPPKSVLDAVYDPTGSKELQSRLAGTMQQKINSEYDLDMSTRGRLERDRDRQKEAFNLESAQLDDPALTHPWNADQERAKRTTDPFQAFGSIGSVFGIIASSFTKTPLVSALNASGAAMTAIHQGDHEAYKSAYEAWKSNSELAVKRFNMEREMFEDANKLSTNDLARWSVERNAIATRFQDVSTQQLLAAGMYGPVLEADAKRVSTAVQFQEAQDKLGTKLRHLQSIQDLNAADDKEHTDAEGQLDPKWANSKERYAQRLQNMLQVTQAEKGVSKPLSPQQEFAQNWWFQHQDGTAEEFGAAYRAAFGPNAPVPKGGAGARPGTPSDDNAKRDADISAAHPDWSPTQVMDERERQKKKAKESEPTMDQAGIDLAANLFIKGNPAATTNVGRGAQGAANLTAIKNRASEILKERGLNPEESATLINENTAAFGGDKRGAASLALRSSQIIGASTVALNTMDRVIETSRKVSRTEFSDINKILLAGEQRTGDTAVVNYGIALNTLVNNYARAIGAGSNALTNTARQEAHDLLQQYWSKGQIEAAIGQMKKELHDELKGAQEARKIWAEGGSAIPESGSGAATSPVKEPPVKLLKEGVVTTFGNGSKWTLRDGKAVKVGE